MIYFTGETNHKLYQLHEMPLVTATAIMLTDLNFGPASSADYNSPIGFNAVAVLHKG